MIEPAFLKPLISVVIPVYNGAVTIDRTLVSVRAQTVTNIEIIVVDDGSNDGTQQIVDSHARTDSRIHIIRQSNQGVAVARNTGTKSARADLVAFIDADDLWRADALRKLASELNTHSQSFAVAYGWFALIDETDGIIDLSHRPRDSGHVLPRFCQGNLVGNASSALFRREALAAIGGFDPTLRARSAQGCEDLQLFFRIAEKYQFAMVPEYITGYRTSALNMSSDLRQMLRSWEIVAEEMFNRHPQEDANIRLGRTYFLRWLAERAMAQRRFGEARHFSELIAQKGAASLRPIAIRFLLSRVNPRRLLLALKRSLGFARFPYGNADRPIS
jgi:glycosyltransferase involved in cell wall biosynthesis